MRKGTYTLQDGTEIAIRGASPMLGRDVLLRVEAEMLAEGLPLEVPQYSVQSVSGDLIWHDHNPSTLVVEDDPEQTAENIRLWRAHKAALKEQARRAESASAELMIVWGIIDLPEMPDDDSWMRRRVLLGLPVPADANALYRMWLTTCWLDSQQDMLGLINAIQRLSFREANWERVAQIEDTFPGSVQGEAAEGGAEE